MPRPKTLDTSGCLALVCCMRSIFIIAVCCMVANCATGNGASRANEIIKTTEEIKSDAKTAEDQVNASHATPEEKAAINSTLKKIGTNAASIEKPVQKLGADVDSEHARADRNAAAASKWRWLMGFLVVGVLVGGGLLIKKYVL